MTPKKQPDVYYCYDELPKWLQNNPFVHRRYRPPKESYAYCFKSVFMLHTETVNIWTHLVAFFIYLYMAVEFFRHQHCPGIYGADKILLSTAYFACMATWLMSTVYHIMICHSVSVWKTHLRGTNTQRDRDISRSCSHGRQRYLKQSHVGYKGF